MHDIAFKEVEIAAGQSEWSHPLSLFDHLTDHAIEYAITGGGTLSISAYTSISGKAWVNNGVKGSGLSATSGPDSDGVDNIPLSLKPGDLIKFKATETSGASSATLFLWFTQK